jgi:Rieske Fe-S protein
MTTVSTDGLTRRHALTGAAAVGVGVPLLAACGSGDGGGSAEPPAPKAGEKLGSASDVPVGGGKIYADQKVVVTQPSDGDFKAFSAVCTHQGCLVESSTEGEIPCPCHLSRFSLEDGSPVSGPASAPLAAVQITVDGDEITQA